MEWSVKSKEQTEWDAEYGLWNAGNLETEGVMDARDGVNVYIHKTHPVNCLLLQGHDITLYGISDMWQYDDLIKISRAGFIACCTKLRLDVLDTWTLTYESPLMVVRARKGGELTARFSLTRLGGSHQCDIIDVLRPMQRNLQNWVHETYYPPNKGEVCAPALQSVTEHSENVSQRTVLTSST